MRPDHLTRRLALVAGGTALIVMGALTAGCGSSTKEEPSSTPATTPSSASPTVSVSPTEKAVGPGDNNSFSPTINPLPPGGNCTKIVNGVCVR